MNFNYSKVESSINTSINIVNYETIKRNWQEYLSKDNKTFYLRDDTPYVILDNQGNSAFTSIAVKTIPYNTNLIEASNIIGNDQIALVTSNKNEFIGYITQRLIIKQLLKEHGELNAYIDTILNTLEDSCTVIDKNKNVVYWTKGAEDIFSIDQKEIIGQPITNYFTRENLEILNALKTGESVYRRQHHARNNLAVLINSNPVVYENQIIGAVVSETDITNLIRLNNELYKTSEILFDLEEKVRKSSPPSDAFSYIKGNSAPLQDTINIAKKAAKTDAPVLILGESGVGKELFAKAVHNIRETETSPFIAINCGAISSSLFESEIFGYEKGAFSGADAKGKKGKAELAQGGTLFLDEI